MTNKEAIEILKPLTGYNVDKNGIGTFPIVNTPLQAEALNLAIKALEEVDELRADADYYAKELEEEWGIIEDEDWEEEE